MAGAAGFEPATLGFGDRCSDQAELRSCDIAVVGFGHWGVGHLASAGKFYGCRNDRSNGATVPSTLGPGKAQVVRGRRKTACKPSSVRHPVAVYTPGASSHNNCDATIIYLAPPLPTGSCGQPREGASALYTPTFPASESGRRPLLGLAPDGVYPALDVSTEAVSSYLAISPLPPGPKGRKGGMFLWHFPSGHPAPPLAGILLVRSPDFPPPVSGRRPSSRLTPTMILSKPLVPMGLSPSLSQFWAQIWTQIGRVSRAARRRPLPAPRCGLRSLPVLPLAHRSPVACRLPGGQGPRRARRRGVRRPCA
jgi:hypothetical protein